MMRGSHFTQSVHLDLEPNILPCGLPTQSLSMYYITMQSFFYLIFNYLFRSLCHQDSGFLLNHP